MAITTVVVVFFFPCSEIQPAWVYVESHTHYTHKHNTHTTRTVYTPYILTSYTLHTHYIYTHTLHTYYTHTIHYTLYTLCKCCIHTYIYYIYNTLHIYYTYNILHTAYTMKSATDILHTHILQTLHTYHTHMHTILHPLFFFSSFG